MPGEDELGTTALSSDYSDYRDTVVEGEGGLDPSLFRAGQAAMADRDKHPGQMPADARIAGKPKPSEASSGGAGGTLRLDQVPDENTWVLEPPSPNRASSGAGSAGASPMQQPPTTQVGSGASGAGYAAPQQPSRDGWQGAPQATSAMMAATDAEPYKMSPALIGAIAGLAAVGLIAVGVVVVLLLLPSSPEEEGETSGNSSAPASAPADATPLSSSASASEGEEEPIGDASSSKSAETSGREASSPAIVNEGHSRALSEAEFYRTLSGYYDLAGDYDAGVRDAAQDFNSTFLKEDHSTRDAKARSVASLKSKIKSSWDDLRRIEPPIMSKNTQAYRDLCELYECLWHRIDVIDQAWKIDLQYDKPQEHESDIIEPLRAQQENGNDRYYTRFKDLYPRVSLVKP